MAFRRFSCAARVALSRFAEWRTPLVPLAVIYVAALCAVSWALGGLEMVWPTAGGWPFRVRGAVIKDIALTAVWLDPGCTADVDRLLAVIQSHTDEARRRRE